MSSPPTAEQPKRHAASAQDIRRVVHQASASMRATGKNEDRRQFTEIPLQSGDNQFDIVVGDFALKEVHEASAKPTAKLPRLQTKVGESMALAEDAL